MIKKININNFKSIRNGKVEFPHFASIVGKNAAGKTNLIQAVKLTRNLVLGGNLDNEQSQMSLIADELFNFNEENPHEFSIEIEVSSQEGKSYILAFSCKMRTDSGKNTLYISKEKLTKLTNNSDTNSIVYQRNENNFLQEGSEPFPLAVEPNKLAIVVYKNNETDEVKNIFRNILIPDFEDFNNANSIGLGSLEKKGDSIVSELADIIINLRRNEKEYQEFLRITKKFMPNFESLTELPASNLSGEKTKQYMLLLDERNLTSSLSMRSVSSGDIRTLYLVAGSLSLDDNSCLIIEEIENGIHPKRMTDLIEQLETIARIKNMQVIFTTHSPLVINWISPSKIILTQKKKEEGTKFTLLEKSEQISAIKNFLENDGELADYLFNK